jgi:hypothetical protein
MSGKTTLLVIIALSVFSTRGWSQLPDHIHLAKPECGTWDSLYNRYLISLNIDNDIVQVDQNGVVTMFKENCGTYITSAGIGGTTFYQSDVTKIRGYDLATANQVFYVVIPGSTYLGGATADSSGNIYVPDVHTRSGAGLVDMIWKIRLSDGAISEFVNTNRGLGFQPRDIVFDPVQNRLIVTFIGDPVYIQAVSVADSTVTNLVKFETKYTNGIARDQFGNIYVAGYDNDTIYRYLPDFSMPAEVVSTGHYGPCNIDYDPRHNILIVPNYHRSTVDFVRMGQPRLEKTEFSDLAGGDGDGIFESNETVELIVTLFNTYFLPQTDVTLELVSATGGLVITQGAVVIGDIPARTEVTNSGSPFVFNVPSEYVYQVNSFQLRVNYTLDTGPGVVTITFPSHYDDDLDRVPDSLDNCPGVYNPDQSDADADSIGDLCDPCTDTDGDFLGNPGFPGTGSSACPLDNCPDVPEYFGYDTDGDGVGDVCDLCPGFDDKIDPDGDGVPSGCDNCPLRYNPGQEDSDGNDVGDVCESCCTGRVGDVNNSGGDEPTISDISTMIDALFISGNPGVIVCLGEADINQSGNSSPQFSDITISDISTLIDYLFITGPSLGLLNCF